MELSVSARLAWALANEEAGLAGAERIEPAHLFLAILRMLDDAYAHEPDGSHPAGERIDLEEEIAAARPISKMSAGEITKLRRSVSRTLRDDRGRAPERQLHRTVLCREVFEKAARLAAQDGRDRCGVSHLLRAILSDPPWDVARFLPSAELKPALEWETAINEFVGRFQLSHLVMMLTDMEGSTAIKARHGDLESARIFRAHDTLFREELRRSPQAREIKTIGDSFLLAFGSEEEAVRFALAVQSRLRQDVFLAAIPVRVRMGIFAGPVLTKKAPGSSLSDPIFGITIDTTARISSLACGNQILTDRAVYEKAAQALASQPPAGLGAVDWRSYGDYTLKGLTAPLEIYEVGEAGQAAFVRPAGSEKAAPADKPAGTRSAQALPPRGGSPFLASLGRDLTELARAGRLTPVVGRRQEMKALARYLERTTKRNVMLIGDAGVGKTAIVEGLAQELAAPHAPDFLRHLRIVQINVADLMAGTKYRGDLEQRLHLLVEEAAADLHIVLFLDEVHLVVRSGSSGGGMDMANILKPALTRDDFRVIGATTTDEFERDIAPERALLRRFQILRVAEPSAAEALEMCRGWARRIAGIQEVVVEDEAVVAAVELSARLIRGRSLPDKAIDLIENAAAAAKITSLSRHDQLPGKAAPRVTRREIEAMIEEQYGVAARAEGVLSAEQAEAHLRAALVGQDAAVQAVCETLRGLRSRASEERRPAAVLLFTGPSGVGKTLAAETLARALFGPDEALIGRFSMSEFKERHDLARLIGAPPGFIGHEQPGALFRYVHSQPQGLVLLDELDKAHAEIQDYFLQIFDKGEARDARGQAVDFRRHVFVVTTNAPEDHTIGLGAIAASDRTVSSLRQLFRAEFLARMDRIVSFAGLDRAAYVQIFDRRLARLQADLVALASARCSATAAARERFAALCLDQHDGARGAERIFERQIAAHAVEGARRGEWRAGARIDWAGTAFVCTDQQ
ncbi:MAG: AAA family ATPase [Vicinamibacteria bacterium]|nr:AAA family ATPase [Vicinamibacteria bacterium]